MSNYENAIRERYAVNDPTLPGWDIRLLHSSVDPDPQPFYLSRPGRLEMQRSLVLNSAAVQTQGDFLTAYSGAVVQQQNWHVTTAATPRLWLAELDCRDGALNRQGEPCGRSGAAMRMLLTSYYNVCAAGNGILLELPDGGSYTVYIQQWHERLQTDALPNLGWLVTLLLLEHLIIGDS